MLCFLELSSSAFAVPGSTLLEPSKGLRFFEKITGRRAPPSGTGFGAYVVALLPRRQESQPNRGHSYLQSLQGGYVT